MADGNNFLSGYGALYGKHDESLELVVIQHDTGEENWQFVEIMILRFVKFSKELSDPGIRKQLYRMPEFWKNLVILASSCVRNEVNFSHIKLECSIGREDNFNRSGELEGSVRTLTLSCEEKDTDHFYLPYIKRTYVLGRT